MKRNIFLAINIILFVTACYDPRDGILVETDMPFEEPVMVINGFIAPQDTIVRITATYSRHINEDYLYYNNIKYMRDAKVMLSNGKDTVRLKHTFEIYEDEYDTDTLEFYSIPASEFPIEGGQSYSLEVTDTEGNKVTASCTVPLTPPALEVSVQKVPENKLEDWKIRWAPYDVQLDWRDPSGFANYYEVSIDKGQYYYDNELGHRIDSLVFYGTYPDPYGPDPFYDDEVKDGTTFSVVRRLHSKTYLEDDELKLAYKIYVLSTDQTYYDYHKALREKPDHIFYTEPYFMPSNVEGGVGIFAAYNYSKVEIDFRN